MYLNIDTPEKPPTESVKYFFSDIWIYFHEIQAFQFCIFICATEICEICSVMGMHLM